MKKLLTVVFTMLLAASLAFAQGTIGDPGVKGKTTETPKTTGKKATKTKKGHKGGKKSKKGNKNTGGPIDAPK